MFSCYVFSSPSKKKGGGGVLINRQRHHTIILSSAKKRLELGPGLWLLVMRGPILLRLNRHPFTHRDLPLPPQILTLTLGRQPQPAQNGAVHRPQTRRVARAQEVNQAVPVQGDLIRRRGDDAVHAALQIRVGPEMQHVGRVDDDAAGDVAHVFPAPVAGLELQAADGLGEDEGDAAEVRVPADEDVFVFLVDGGGAGVVFDVAGEGRAACFVLVVVDEEVFGDFQHVGEEA